jgi:hypothetical protein
VESGSDPPLELAEFEVRLMCTELGTAVAQRTIFPIWGPNFPMIAGPQLAKIYQARLPIPADIMSEREG